MFPNTIVRSENFLPTIIRAREKVIPRHDRRLIPLTLSKSASRGGIVDVRARAHLVRPGITLAGPLGAVAEEVRQAVAVEGEEGGPAGDEDGEVEFDDAEDAQ